MYLPGGRVRMLSTPVSLNQTSCQIKEVRYINKDTLCDRCRKPAQFFATAERSAIDVHLDHPVLLQVTVSVHHCSECNHYFRSQPPFLQRGTMYSQRVIDKAVQSVYTDGMAMRRVPARLARDFWIRPSEGSVRRWCRLYS